MVSQPSSESNQGTPSTSTIHHALQQGLMLDEDGFIRVSSFYGPGPVIAWYLTGAACMVAWTLHRTRRWADSIDNDFAALLSYPAIASVHLILQARSLDVSTAETAHQLPRAMRSIETALNIVENSIMITALATLICLWHHSFARALLLFSTVVLSLIGEVYFGLAMTSLPEYVSWFMYSRVFSRRYLSDTSLAQIMLCYSGAVWLAFVSLLLWCISHGGTPFKGPHKCGSLDQRRRFYSRLYRSHPVLKNSQHFAWMLCLAAIVLVPTSLSLVIFTAENAVAKGRSREAMSRNRMVHRVVTNLFPRTENSVAELDQAATAFAGAAVLAFSVYSASKSQYKAWKTWATIQPDFELNER